MIFFHIFTLNNKLSVKIAKGSVSRSIISSVDSKKIYPDDIAKWLDHSILSFVVSEQIKALKSKGHVVSKNTVEMNQLSFNDSTFIKLFEMLIGFDLVFFNKRKVKIETTKANLTFKCIKANETLKVHSFLDVKNKLISIEKCSFVNSFMVVSDNGLFLFKDTLEKKWLKVIENNPCLLQKREAKYFLEDFEYKISFEKPQQKQPVPLLALKDIGGISASLKFLYDDKEYDAFLSESSNIRNFEAEKDFQNDLSEAGYQRKDNENIFYCPQPKVFEVLKLLIEIGWNVSSYRQKKVVLEDNSKIAIKKCKTSIKLDADISFKNGESIDADQIFQMCLRKQNFFEFKNEIALIDSLHYQKKFKGFLEEKKTVLPLSRIGEIKELDENLEESLLHLKEVFAQKRRLPEVKPGDTFSGKLLKYQKIGLHWLSFLYENKLGALLADEMGLGKTVQVLAFFSQLRKFCPVLIVAPKSLVNNWLSEFKRFLPSADVTIYYGADREANFNLNSFTVTTYGTLRMDAEKLSQIQFECVVLDESSFIKNDKTKSNKSADSLNAFFKVCLNGTPIENSTDDLIAQFNFLIPNLLNSKNKKNINSLISPFLLKRCKKSVEIDLPEKNEQIVYVDLDEQQKLIYQKTINAVRTTFYNEDEVKNKKMHVFEALLRLRQICCDPSLAGYDAPSSKLQQVLADIKSVAHQHKILVFSQFTKMLQKIQLELMDYNLLYLDGNTPIKQRQQMVIDFQTSNDPSIFLMSLKAASYGLNLQEADYVFIFDPWWNEAVEKQAIDRAHRIGRSRSLIAKKYLTTGTIEEKIYRLKLDKLKASDQFIPQNLNTDDLYYLLH